MKIKLNGIDIFLLINQTGFESGIGPPPATSFTGQNSEMNFNIIIDN